MMAKAAELFLKGGPVMWPILGLSVMALAILVWNLIALAKGEKPSAKSLSVVSAVITAEPMLGILGTVIGIMNTFKTLDGGNPLEATAGIGEALITTAAGLIASLILLFPYNLVDSALEDE